MDKGPRDSNRKMQLKKAQYSTAPTVVFSCCHCDGDAKEDKYKVNINQIKSNRNRKYINSTQLSSHGSSEMNYLCSLALCRQCRTHKRIVLPSTKMTCFSLYIRSMLGFVMQSVMTGLSPFIWCSPCNLTITRQSPYLYANLHPFIQAWISCFWVKFR